MKKVSIVGANSFLARNLVHLVGNQARFRLYDRDSGSLDGLASYRQIDLMDAESAAEVDFDCDVLFLFAGMTGTACGFDQYETFLDVNERALLHLLTALRRTRHRPVVVFPSTRLVYRGAPHPLAEDAPLEFKTIYAMNKFACEGYLHMHWNMFDIPYIVFRISVPYGSCIRAESYGTLSLFLRQASSGGPLCLYGGGRQKRTFTHIEDLCRLMWQGAGEPLCRNGVFNVGGEARSLRDIALRIAQARQVAIRDVEWPESDLRLESGDTVLDSTKIDTLLGFHYQHVLEDWMAGESAGASLSV